MKDEKASYDKFPAAQYGELMWTLKVDSMQVEIIYFIVPTPFPSAMGLYYRYSVGLQQS